MDAFTRLRVAYAYFGKEWVNFEDLKERYWFLVSMERR